MYQNLRKDRKITYRISSSMILGLIGFLISFFPVHFYFPGCTATASENKPSDQDNCRQVLVLNSYHAGYEWADGTIKGIREQFDESGEKVDLYIEFMDTKRYSDDDHFSHLRELYKYKFSDRNFDVIIACDDNALNFLLANRKNLAPRVPIVFCGINNFTPSRIAGYENITGVVEGVNFRANIDLALELHPNLKRIVVIGGSTLSIVSMRRRLEQVVPEYVDRVKFDYLVNLSMSDLLKRLEDVPRSDVVFHLGVQKDKDGKNYIIKHSNKLTTSRCKAPVYTCWNHMITPGVFGGYVVNSVSQGRTAADLAMRILRGEDADDIPVITESPNSYMFNHNQLQRFGIDMSSLPESSIILGRPFSFYETYKKTIWSVVSAFILLLSIVAILARSITLRKSAEEALRESAEKFRGLFNDALDMIHIVDANGNIIDVNQAELETMAYTRDEYIGKHILEIVHPDYQTVSKTALDSAFEGKEVRELETAWITKHGKRIDVEVNAVPQIERGKIVSVRAIARDITERKQTEEEKKELEAKFQEAQKMEAIGTLAGGIAHDFNNLLMSIQGNISLMLLNIDSTHPHYKFLTTIQNEITNGAELTKQLLGYARKGRYYVQLININELVEKTAMSVGIARREISIHQELAGDLFAIEADQGQIQQVLLNLLVNAADAMPGGGDLILKTANVTDKDIKGKVYDPKPGDYVLLTITDTGTGMDKETIKRIFDPFFTTKEMGRGTGLGLASTYGIIKGHGGYIDVDSEPGRGTTFTIYLPATEKKVEKAAKPAEQMVKGTETILLVDDEERVLDVYIWVLKGLGYTVLGAKDGREAVEIYEENKDKIDLVILDMVMPRMGGGEAYDKMKEINPKVKVLLSSGYSIDSEAKEILARGCDAFIQKPFGMQELSQRIREILEKGV